MGRFNRQIVLPEIGLVNQNIIGKNRVSVIGVGGLGCPVALYLAAAGVGHLTLIDADKVKLDNLNRQVLFGVTDIGKNKAQTAAQKLNLQFDDVSIQGLDAMINEENAANLLDNCDLIVDCSDNFTCRYATTSAAEQLGKTILTGSLYRNEGQLLCFNPNEPGYKSYRSLFPNEMTKLNSNNCEESGVLGSNAGLIGSLLATEVIHQIIDKTNKLVNEMIIYNQNSYSMYRLKF